MVLVKILAIFSELLKVLACFNVQCQLSLGQYFSFGWIVWMKKCH